MTDRYGSTEQEESNVAVPDWFWDNCLHDRDTVLNWNIGRFAGKGCIDGDEYKVILSGVEFQGGAIVEIGDMEVSSRGDERSESQASGDVQSISVAPAGRPMSDRWRHWAAELAYFIHHHGIPEGEGSQGQEEVIKAIADRLAERGEETLSRSTVQPVVQAVLDRLRVAGN